MKTIIKIQKSVSNLLKNEQQSLDRIIEDLHKLYITWHHKDRDLHLCILFKAESIRDYIIYLNQNKDDLVQIINPIDDSWFSFHPEDGIDSYLDSLHDLMISWSAWNEDYNDAHSSIHITYKVLRTFLKDLKNIELDYMNERFSKVS